MENIGNQEIPNMGDLGASIGGVPDFGATSFDVPVAGEGIPAINPSVVPTAPVPPTPPAVPNVTTTVMPIGDMQAQGRKIINEMGVDEIELRAQRGRKSQWLRTLCEKPAVELEDGSMTKATTTAVGFVIKDHEGTVHIKNKAHLLAHMFKYTGLEIGDPTDATHPYTLKIQRKIVKNVDLNSPDQSKKFPITFGIITASKEYNLTHWDKSKEKFDCVDFIKEPIRDADNHYVRLPKDKNTVLDYNNIQHLVENSKLQWQTIPKYLKEFPNRQRKNNKQAKDKQTLELFMAYGMMNKLDNNDEVVDM